MRKFDDLLGSLSLSGLMTWEDNIKTGPKETGNSNMD
jgi:hypothetical protein